MQAELCNEIKINRKNLEVIDTLIETLEEFKSREIDSCMPVLEYNSEFDIDDQLDYYYKVRKHIINELKEQLKQE